MEVKDLIGLDVGKKRSGIARASTVARLAEPLMSIETSDLILTLNDLLDKETIEAVVVGLPRNLSGDDTRQTEWVRDWVEKAQAQVKTTFYWQDEALTSKVAQLHKQSGKDPVDEHAMAAAIILQDFMDTPETERAPC